MTDIKTAVLAMEIDTEMLRIMRKLHFTITRLNPGKNVSLKILDSGLAINDGERDIVTATKNDNLSIWHIAGDAWLIQYVY